MKTLVSSFVAGMLLAPCMVIAGTVAQVNVEIDLEEMSARGSLTTARFSDDPQELIGCGVRHTLEEGGGLDSWAFCQARVSPDNFVLCLTYNPEMIDKIAGLNSYSYVEFKWDEDGECTHFGFSTQSLQIPENVGKKLK